jgi:hypothetical protein
MPPLDSVLPRIDAAAPAELREDMTRSDLIYVLDDLHFRGDGCATLRIDRPVRDYLVRRLGGQR